MLPTLLSEKSPALIATLCFALFIMDRFPSALQLPRQQRCLHQVMTNPASPHIYKYI